MTTTPLGLHADSVETWFLRNVPGTVGPLRYDRITGGHSCLTFVLTDANSARYVLRRPPVGTLLATAHNVTREHRIMEALAASGVPVPRMVAVCEDVEITGAPFFVMSYVDGVVLNSTVDADRLLPSGAARARAGETLVDALVALHAVDVDEVGLGTLSRRSGYIDRQLQRWAAQWAASSMPGLDGMEELHGWLVAHRPAESGARIVHGDYRLGNALFAPDGRLLAILDWELCTLGDPLSDVAYLLRSWSTADARTASGDVPTLSPGFCTVEELAARYAAGSGRSLDSLEYWMAFTAWRAAAMLAGVHRRYVDGKMGAAPEDLGSFPLEVAARLRQGLQYAAL